MGEVCGDNRFEIIQRAKDDLINSTNIKTSLKEMEVLDNFLFRCWQMGWLKQYDEDILNGLINVVKTAEVVEERETTTCICSVQKEDTYDCLYDVYYYTCGNCFESVKTEIEEENFKFCPYCGAKYEKIVKH